MKDVIVGEQLTERDSEQVHLTVESLGTDAGNAFSSLGTGRRCDTS